jgi:hypothetical protein
VGTKAYTAEEILGPFRGICDGGWDSYRAHRAGKYIGACLQRYVAGKYPPVETVAKLAELRAADTVGAIAWLERELPGITDSIPSEFHDLFLSALIEVVGGDGRDGPVRREARVQAAQRRNRKRAERRARKGIDS